MVANNLQSLKSKKLLMATWNCANKDFYQNRDWIQIFNELFGKQVVFSPRENYLRFGKEKMNSLFLKLVKKEQPEYIILSLSYEEFYPETLLNIKKMSPKSKVANFFGDDNWRYEDWSRFYAPFFDYVLISELDNTQYKLDRIDKKKIFFLHGINPEVFKKLIVPKKYDVTFIGSPVRDRADYLKYLITNGINLRIFGEGWSNFPEFKGYYGGFLKSEDYVKVINESKINLNFSKSALPEKGKNDTQFKGRTIEIMGSEAFLLTEDSPGTPKFIDKEIIFRDKEDLLKKIQFFLTHESAGAEITSRLSGKIRKTYVWKEQFKKFFKQAEKDKSSNRVLDITPQKKIISLNAQQLNQSIGHLKNITADYKYIKFNKEPSIESKWRNFFQVYALEKSNKPIGCCDYYATSAALGEYALVMAKKSFKTEAIKDIKELFSISQLLVTRDYFINNLSLFKKLYIGEYDYKLLQDNLAFVSIPLISILRNIKNLAKTSRKAIRMLYLDKLYSLKYQKKIFVNPYTYKLAFSLIKYPLIAETLWSTALDKESREKAKVAQ